MNERREGSHFTPEEIGSRGREIYERRIRDEVEPSHIGEFIIIDITTGEYEIGGNGREATDLMRRRNPEAVMYGTRVGAKTAYRIGFAPPRR